MIMATTIMQSGKGQGYQLRIILPKYTYRGGRWGVVEDLSSEVDDRSSAVAGRSSAVVA